MKILGKTMLMLFVLLCAVSARAAQSDIDSLLAQNPGLLYYESSGPGETYPHKRIYGVPFDTGSSVLNAAQNVLDKHIGVFGLDTSDVELGGPGVAGLDTVSLIYDETSGDYKFQYVYYKHRVTSSSKVLDSWISVLVRNVAPFNVVMVAGSVRDLGAWVADEDLISCDADSAVVGFTDSNFPELNLIELAEAHVFVDSTLSETPVVVFKFVATDSLSDEGYYYVIDADTKEILVKEDMGQDLDVSGSVTGYSTTGIKPLECNSEVEVGLPSVLVQIVGGDSVYTDANGDYLITGLGGSSITLKSYMRGENFTVVNNAGSEVELSEALTPTDSQDYVHDWQSVEADQAQVNAYVAGENVMKFAKDAFPAFPGIDDYNLRLIVNSSGMGGGARYVKPVNAIPARMLLGDGGSSRNNLSYSSVVNHEYGHHLEWLAGSDYTGSYAEGFCDVLALILAESPEVAPGITSGDCSSYLRTADTAISYPYYGNLESHAHGRLVSSCVWDLLEELEVTEPTDYIEILTKLAISQLFVQAGVNFDYITPTIYIDYLVLDDDDGDIWNGTPHSQEITTAFNNHGMLPDVVPLLVPEYYSTIQEAIDASGTGDTVTVGNDGIPTYYAEVLNFDGKAITVIGEFSSVYNPVRIKGAHFESGEDSTSVLENFKISGWDYGVLCYNSAPTLKRLFITGIKPTVQSKAAIHLAGTGWNSDGDSPAKIINCTITDSWRGIYYHVDSGAGSAFVRNCVIEDVTTGIANVGDTSVTAFVLDYNDVYDATVTYFQVTDSGSNSIDDDPNIVNSLPYYPSAAIDAGDPDSSYNDPDDSQNDMGWRPCMICEDLGGFPREVAEDGSVLPTEFALDQNHPNPFNPVTQISLSLPKASDWRIEIFNMLGQRVDEFSGQSEPGVVTVSWDGSRYASGMYLYKATAGEFSQTKKMVLVK